MSVLGTAATAAGWLGERFPQLGDIPAPHWLMETLEGHQRRERLVLAIAALTDADTARLILWISRVYGLGAAWDWKAGYGGRVEAALSIFRHLVEQGAPR